LLQNKYFDSGDYNMARAQMVKHQAAPEVKQLNQVTGDHMPTPDELPRVRKASQSSLVISHSTWMWLQVQRLKNLYCAVRGRIRHFSVCSLTRLEQQLYDKRI